MAGMPLDVAEGPVYLITFPEPSFLRIPVGVKSIKLEEKPLVELVVELLPERELILFPPLLWGELIVFPLLRELLLPLLLEDLVVLLL